MIPPFIEDSSEPPATFLARLRDLIAAPKPYVVGLRYRHPTARLKIELLLDPHAPTVPIYWHDTTGHRDTRPPAEILGFVTSLLAPPDAPVPDAPMPSPEPAQPPPKRPVRVGQTLELF